MCKTKTFETTHLSNGALLDLTFNLSIQRMFGNGYTVMHCNPQIGDAPEINKYKSKNAAYNAYADYLKNDVMEKI